MALALGTHRRLCDPQEKCSVPFEYTFLTGLCFLHPHERVGGGTTVGIEPLSWQQKGHPSSLSLRCLIQQHRTSLSRKGLLFSGTAVAPDMV